MSSRIIHTSEKEEVVELFDLASKLIKIPSVNHEGRLENLDRISRFIAGWFTAHGIRSRIIEFRKGHPVVIAEVGTGKKTILLNGHMDVVPQGDGKWVRDPFSGTVSNGKLFGRGAADMKSGLAMFMLLMSRMKEHPGQRLIFTAVSDEETGGFNCSRYLAEKYSPDLVLVAEPTGLRYVGIGEKGVLHVKLRTQGKASHSSRPSLGKNAVVAMIGALDKLSGISKMPIKFPEAVRPALLNSRTLFGSDAVKITINPSVLRGGNKVNVVPDSCEADVDMRLPPGVSSKKVLDTVRKLAPAAEVEKCPSSESNYTDMNDRHVHSFMKSVARHAKYPKPIVSTGASDGRFFRYKGIPTISYGPGNFDMAHSNDEYVDLSEFKAIYEVYLAFLSSFSYKLHKS